MGRAHANGLKELKSKKEFDSGYISKHKDEFSAVEEVVCMCKGKKHSAKCGCFSDAFIESAGRNLYCPYTMYQQCERVSASSEQSG